MNITNFEIYYDYYRNKEVLLITWNDKFISKSYLNVDNLNIS